MKRSQLVWRLLVALALCVAIVTLAGRARAGTLGVHDEAHSLSSQDIATLRSVLAAQPFDGRVAFTTEHADPQGLAGYARSILTEPNMVVVAVDPEHRHVRVEYGEGAHVARSAWPNIDRAGNAAFAHGAWEEGVAAIFTTAGRSVDGSAAPAPVDGPAMARRPSLFGPVLLVVLIGGAIAAGLYFARRRRLEGSYGSGGFGPGGYGPMGGPPYGGGYAPPPGGGLGPLGGGVIGAGLGGLAGYELGKIEGEREGHERGSSWGGGSSGDDQGGGFDAGGGDSSWGDGGGGSNDGGGGGFDGGGGGGDF